MRAGGINWLAVLIAAIAVYAIGFIIYGMLVPEEVANAGATAEEMAAIGDSRMPFGVVMPLLTAGAMALLFKWGKVAGAGDGMRWAAAIALASAIPALLYGWVYGVGPIDITMIDVAHLFAGHVAAGAILGAWR